jgi:hypothetical protein
MIDLLNRIGFRQIAFGGEGGGGGGGARGMPAASNNVVKNAALRKNIMNHAAQVGVYNAAGRADAA